jgi:hypothetical protein
LNLGMAALCQDQLEAAADYCREGVVLSREIGYKRGMIFCLFGLATVAAAQQRVVRAAQTIGVIDGLLEATGHSMPPVMQTMHERTIASTRAALGEAAFAEARAEGHSMPPEEAVAHALDESIGD